MKSLHIYWKWKKSCKDEVNGNVVEMLCMVSELVHWVFLIFVYFLEIIC